MNKIKDVCNARRLLFLRVSNRLREGHKLPLRQLRDSRVERRSLQCGHQGHASFGPAIRSATQAHVPAEVARARAKGSGPWRVILVDAKRLYSAVVSPEAGLAKIILAEIKDARRRIKLLPWKWATRASSGNRSRPRASGRELAPRPLRHWQRAIRVCPQAPNFGKRLLATSNSVVRQQLRTAK